MNDKKILDKVQWNTICIFKKGLLLITMFSPLVRIVFFACLGHFCIDFMIGIWPVFKTLAHLDLAMAGLIAAFCVTCGEGMQFFFGSLCDRGYAKICLLFGLCISVCSTLLPLAPNYLFIMALFLGTCIGSSSFHPTAVSVLGSLDVKNRSSIMGLFTAAGMLGLGVSQICFTTTFFGRDGSTELLAIPALLVGICSFLFLPKQKIEPAHASKAFSFKLLRSFFQNSALRALFIAFLGNQVMMWSLVFLLPDYLQSRGFSYWVVFGGGHLSLMLGATLSPPLFGYLADRISVRKVLVAVSTVSFAAYYVQLFSTGMTEVEMLILLFFQGALLGGISPLVWSYGTKLVPEHRGLVSAFLMGLVWIFSEAFGVGIAGVLAHNFSENGPTLSLMCMGIMGIPALIFAVRLPKKDPSSLSSGIDSKVIS